MSSGSICAILWQLLSLCNLRQTVLKARHIPGRLNVITHKLSCQHQVILTIDNTTVVAYVNKDGGMRLSSLCALLWRLFPWCNLRQIVQKARHIQGHLTVTTDKVFQQGQVIQMEWSL